MRIQRNTVQWRLWQWGQFEIEARQEITRSTSPFGSLAENPDGRRGEGMKGDVIDGVMCAPDGGLGAHVERAGRVIAHNIRCKETRDAVSWLPDQMRRIVVDTYVVKNGREPRSAREVAARLNIHHSTVQESLNTAHDRISLRIYGPFQILSDESGDELEDSLDTCAAYASRALDSTPPPA